MTSSLAAFYFFNPTLGGERTEGKKILYFYPQLDLNVQKDYVGISEGIIAFTSHFSSTPCEAVHTQKQRFAFYCCEPNFWVALAVNNPSITSAGESTGSQSSGKGGKGASEETTYFEDEIEDNVLQGIIQRCYRLFRLFNGTFQSIADANNGDMDAVRKRLNLFMEFFVPSVRYQQLPFFTDLHGFQFLPVDKATFLTVQYVINLIRSQFPSVQAAAVIFNSKLIWSGVNQEDMSLLYSLQQEPLRSFYMYLKINQRYTDSDGRDWTGVDGKEEEEKAKTGGNGDGRGDGGDIAADSAGSDGADKSPGRSDSLKMEDASTVQQQQQQQQRQQQYQRRLLRQDPGWLTGPYHDAPMINPTPTAASSASTSTSSQSTAGTGIPAQASPSPSAPVVTQAGTTAPSSNGAFNLQSAPLIFLSPNQPWERDAHGGNDSGHDDTNKNNDTGKHANANGKGKGKGENDTKQKKKKHKKQKAPVSKGPYRFLVYQKYKISLLLIVADKPAAQYHNPSLDSFLPKLNSFTSIYHSPNTSSNQTNKNGSKKIDADNSSAGEKGENDRNCTSNMSADSSNGNHSTDNDKNDNNKNNEKDGKNAKNNINTNHESANDGEVKDTGQCRPPLSLYARLETFMGPTLRKLAMMLSEQSARASKQDEPFRFLYFNHMNLALKTSLDPNHHPLNMSTIKLIRTIHNDFAKSDKALKRKLGGAITASSVNRGRSNDNGAANDSGHDNDDGNSNVNGDGGSGQGTDEQKGDVSIDYNRSKNSDNGDGHGGGGGGGDGDGGGDDEEKEKALFLKKKNMEKKRTTKLHREQLSQVCVRSKHANGWVIGRRATQSHREFYVLLDDSCTNLSQVQEEVDELSRTYFYNIFIH